MADDFVLSQLNEQQLDIVCRPKDENILVIAGAGTGKTRVLISRICSLIETEGVSPNSILAVTFTNKAALEMKERLIKAMHWENQDFHMWVMTFHSLCARLLHMFAPQAMLPSNFVVLGTKDQNHIIKDFLDKNDFTKSYTAVFGQPKTQGTDVNSIVDYINYAKSHGWRCRIPGDELVGYMNDFKPAWLNNSHDRFLEIMHGIYNILCERAGVVDFNELLQRCVWLLENNDEVRTRLNYRFKYIMIDEFQDTDKIQYKIMRLLKGDQGRVFIVGDDDQAIYGWRGADYNNLNNLVEDVPDINLLPLNINYRSTQNILNFANSLIFNEPRRILAKRLLTPDTYEQQRQRYPDYSAIELAEVLPKTIYDVDEPKVIVGRVDSEFYEGQYVSHIIRVLHRDFKVPLSQIAVLYRKNSLSSSVEMALNSDKIPYHIYGGLKFYEREEILDAMAYLRLMCNPNDDVALSRVYNVPKRKLGQTSWTRLSAYATACGCSVYEAVQRLQEQSNPPKDVVALVNKFKPLFALIAKLSEEVDKRSLPNLINYMLHTTGLISHYAEIDQRKNNARVGTSKVDNLKQLLVNAEHFMLYASLQDINIENMDVDDVLPLPNAKPKRKRRKPRVTNDAYLDPSMEAPSAVSSDEIEADETALEAGDDTGAEAASVAALDAEGDAVLKAGDDAALADGSERLEPDELEGGAIFDDDDDVYFDDFDINADDDEVDHQSHKQVMTEELEHVQQRIQKRKVDLSSYVYKIVDADSGESRRLVPKDWAVVEAANTQPENEQAKTQNQAKSTRRGRPPRKVADASVPPQAALDEDSVRPVKSRSRRKAKIESIDKVEDQDEKTLASIDDESYDVLDEMAENLRLSEEALKSNHGDASLSLAAQRSASRTLDDQSLGALALRGFTPKELLNSFLCTAALTASAESTAVGQIPLAGLELVDKELSDTLNNLNLSTHEAKLREQAESDLEAFTALNDRKGGAKAAAVDSVQLMTIHAAKGLEFEAVIVIGCEEGNMPSARALKDEYMSESLSEERRLAYVAFTRAKRYLVVTFNSLREGYANGVFGTHSVEPSRFLFEAEAETKSFGKSAPFINTPFTLNMSDSHIGKFFITEKDRMAEQIKKRQAKKEPAENKGKTAAQMLAEAAKHLGRRSRGYFD